jgi:hypothetical protein
MSKHFRFKSQVFKAEQVSRDTPAEFPHIQVLVPAGDWIISEVSPDGKKVRPALYLTNARFRELMEPVDDAAAAQLAAAVPVYIPAPNAGAAEVNFPEAPGVK